LIAQSRRKIGLVVPDNRKAAGRRGQMEKQINLLIIDDEVEFVEALAERLGQRGFDVMTANDGETAIDLAEKHKFDLALVDLRMPGMDGQTLLKSLKERHRFIEVIILTGYGSVESAFECSKLGALGYLAKPFEMDHLLNTLRDAFSERMRKKFEKDRERAEKISKLAMGRSPLGILRAMKQLDDEEK
jgi:DNA-binding NtrC family response regulator